MARTTPYVGQTNLNNEMAIINECYDPDDARQLQIISCLELMAGAGRTIICAAKTTGLTVEQATRLLSDAKTDGRFFLCRQRVANQCAQRNMELGNKPLDPVSCLRIRCRMSGPNQYVRIEMSDNCEELLSWTNMSGEYRRCVGHAQLQLAISNNKARSSEPDLSHLVIDDTKFKSYPENTMDAFIIKYIKGAADHDTGYQQLLVTEGISSTTIHRWHTATNTIDVHARRAFNAITEHMYAALINMTNSENTGELALYARYAVIVFMLGGSGVFCEDGLSMHRLLCLKLEISPSMLLEAPQLLSQRYPGFTCSHISLEAELAEYPLKFLVNGWLRTITRLQMCKMLGRLGETEVLYNNVRKLWCPGFFV